MNKIISKPELLSPAGNIEKLKWAIRYGADAVYIGGKNYSLRANASNFSISDIEQAVIYAHKRNVKVYVAVNIIFHNEDFEGLGEYLKKLKELNVDAIIISDLVLIKYVNKYAKGLNVHISTQRSTLNIEAVKYLEKQGVSRIVLAREMHRDDIKNIIENTNIQIECFIHGAMCINYSGRCVLSSYLTNRDPNRGGCSQPCRFNYELLDENKNGVSKDFDFSISPKDLSLIDYIEDMIKIGVTSFKIEGRMRSIYYISTVINIYKKIINNYMNNCLEEHFKARAKTILYRCANREVCPQNYNKSPGLDEQYYIGRKEETNQDFLGIVIGYDKNYKEIIIEQRNFFKVGDKINIFGPNIEDINIVVKYIKNSKDKKVDAARHPQEIIKVPYDKEIPVNSLVRIDFFVDKKLYP